jgi:hypothetical protein
MTWGSFCQGWLANYYLPVNEGIKACWLVEGSNPGR